MRLPPSNPRTNLPHKHANAPEEGCLTACGPLPNLPEPAQTTRKHHYEIGFSVNPQNQSVARPFRSRLTPSMPLLASSIPSERKPCPTRREPSLLFLCGRPAVGLRRQALSAALPVQSRRAGGDEAVKAIRKNGRPSLIPEGLVGESARRASTLR